MSSEKQYKYIEDKIKDAADAAEYAFNEASWKKMEVLLDKKTDKRRPFFWIFSALLLGVLLLVGVIIYLSGFKNEQSENTGKQVVEKSKNKETTHPLNGAPDKVIDKQTVVPERNTENKITSSDKPKNTNSDLIAAADNNQGKQNTYRSKISKQNPVHYFTPEIKLNSGNPRLKNVGTTNSADDNYNAVNKKIYTDKHKFAVKIITPQPENDKGNNENKTDIYADDALADIKKTKTGLQKTDIAKPEETNKADTTLKKTNTVLKTENKKDKKSNPISGFYLVGTIGAEASSTKLLSYKNSSIVISYGAGLGYRFNRHLSLQTGFYAGAKKYIAGPNDYKPKAGTYLSTVKIIKVDANCMVYEVPVTLQYNWLIKPKTNYYAALGVSSYIMKKEKYNYTFERNYTQYTYPYDYTKNSHLFASIQLSSGIEKQLSRKLFIQAAPTVILPLQGVGEGSVKIFTTRLTVGLKYHPFKF